MQSIWGNPIIKVSLNPQIKFFPPDRMFHCELSQTFLLVGSPSITHKQDREVHVFSVLWTLLKCFGNTEFSKSHWWRHKGINKWPMLSKQLPNSEWKMLTCTSLSLWYPFQSLESKTQRRLKQILPKKKNKMWQIVWETQTGECLAVGTLHGRIHFLLRQLMLLSQLTALM